jgi:hypothetical protein
MVEEMDSLDKNEALDLVEFPNGRKAIGSVITQTLVWKNPKPNTKCVTQVRTPIIFTLIDVPLILVEDKSNTMEASWMTLGGI